MDVKKNANTFNVNKRVALNSRKHRTVKYNRKKTREGKMGTKLYFSFA